VDPEDPPNIDDPRNTDVITLPLQSCGQSTLVFAEAMPRFQTDER
jgi:hypothetical protein